MGILTANLKHLYQRRGVWFWYVILLCQTPMILMPNSDRYLGYLIFSFFAGLMAGGLQKDVLVKPFSFCLPNHRRIPRTFIFWIGGVVNFILGCVFLRYPGLSYPYILLIILAGGFVGLTAYFYGVYSSFLALPTPAAGIIPLLAAGIVIFKWDVAVQNVVVSQPTVMIIVGGLMCVCCWKLLGRDFLARKYCGKLIMGMFDSWDLTKIEKYRQARAERNMTDRKVKFFEKAQRFFLGKMERYDFMSRGRYIWGNIYMTFGKYFGFWNMWHILGFFALIVFMILFFGFMGPRENDKRMIGILFIMPAFGMFSLDLMSYQTMVFPAGRRDKYYSTLILSAVITMLAGLLVLAVTGISIFLETILPEFSFRGGPMLRYYGMDIGDFYIYWLFMPVTLSLTLAFPRTKLLLKIALVMVFMQAWIVYEIVSKQNLIDMIGPIGVLGIIAFCWIDFLVVLHYVCMRRSLVSQGR